MYFAYKSEEFTNDLIQILEKKGKLMEANINILWNLKQTLCFEPIKLTGMRKLHVHNHLGEHIRRFGAPVYADTDSYESAHKRYTTGLWRNTSRRQNDLIKEMTNATIRQQHCNHIRMISELKKWDGANIFESVYFDPTKTTHRKYYEKKPITPLHTLPKYQCRLEKNSKNEEVLVGCNLHWDCVLLDKFFGHQAITSIKQLPKYLMDHIRKVNLNEEIIFNTIVPNISETSFYILQGVALRGDIESGVLPGYIYCTNEYKGEYKRYDYINVDVKYDDGTTGKQVAQVICILAMLYQTSKIEEAEYLFIVQFLQEDERPCGTSNDFNFQFKQQRWEQVKYTNKDGKKLLKYSIQCITFSNIIDTAVIIPFFSVGERTKNNNIKNKMNPMPLMGQPTLYDRFYYIKKNTLIALVGMSSLMFHQVIVLLIRV